jgi:hypothetical protein
VMIILLFVLAGLMVLCGSAAALLGWDVVLNERGWTQVIAGASFVTGGLLLFGIAVAALPQSTIRPARTKSRMIITNRGRCSAWRSGSP